MKILITGGHLTPALAVIDEIKKQNLAWQIVFAGRGLAQEKEGQPSHEEPEIAARGLKFVDFDATKTGHFNFFKLIKSVKIAKQVLQENHINVVLTFGGYLAVPFAIAGKILGLPIITHEQTRVLGHANSFVALLADKIALSFADTKTFFKRKTVITGNPLRAQIFDEHASPPTWFAPVSNDKPLLYISGGSQGSKIINENVAPLIPKLLEKYAIIHQVGATSSQRDPKVELQNIFDQNQSNIIINQTADYFVRDYLSATELAFFYPRFSLAISRAGANTVAEFLAFSLPTLYIPLHFANKNEQYENATSAAKLGLALILEQKNLTQESLQQALHNLEKLPKQVANTAPSPANHAADEIINLIKTAHQKNNT